MNNPGYMDKDGNNMISDLDDDDYSEGMAAVKIRGKWGYVDENDKVMVDFRFEPATPFNEGFARVLESEQWGFIDTEGKYVISC